MNLNISYTFDGQSISLYVYSVCHLKVVYLLSTDLQDLLILHVYFRCQPMAAFMAISSPIPMQMHTWALIHPNLTFAYESGGVSIVLSVCVTKRTERNLFRRQKD